ncbi:protein of unknown function [Lachnospiraceae bacterium XBB2008]|nr:protein of unknown function [Lachnospiraceae bacterium XBB2008]
MEETNSYKLIIYGKGRVLSKNENLIPWDNVVAFGDRSACEGELYNGIPVVSPDKIKDFSYDYVIIFSDLYYIEIRNELIFKYDVLMNSIFSWQILRNDFFTENKELLDFLCFFLNACNCDSILEIGTGLLGKIRREVINLPMSYEYNINLVGSIGDEGWKNVYDNMFSSIDSAERRYDLLILYKDFEDYAHIDTINKIGFSRLIYIDNPLSESATDHLNDLRQLYGENVYTFAFNTFIVFLISFDKKIDNIDYTNYVVTHKPFQINCGKEYSPICVGGYKHTNWLSEEKGENIHSYNDRINECTALYWIWKNTKEQYVGLSHYRRFFYNSAYKHEINRLSESTVKRILVDGKVQIILPSLLIMGYSVMDNIRATVSDRYCDEGYDILSKLIGERCPDYLDSFMCVMNGNLLYRCNMFVCSRIILDKYCDWLFSFLIDAADLLDVSEANAYQKRTIGYFAEAMWTVWIRNHSYKVYELPVSDV